MDHTQAYFHWFTKTHAHVHLCRCQQACIEQSEKHILTVCPCEDEGRTMQRKDGGSNAAESNFCSMSFPCLVYIGSVYAAVLCVR